ncbi:hypothetical protein [Solidesulfovibrio sp.]
MAGLKTVRLGPCLGLNTVADPARLKFDAETGAWESPKLLNADLDATGRVNRRRGFSVIQPDAWHSLWSAGSVGYAVSGTALYEVNEAGVLRLVKSDMVADLPVSFVDVDGTVYWCNGAQRGKIVDGEAVEWAGTYPHPRTVRIVGEPPMGHLLEAHSGRIYIAVDNVIYFTEGAGLYDFVCMADGFLPFFPSKVTMMRAIDDGIYIGTAAGVDFVGGTDPGKFQYRRVTNSAPVPGTDVLVPGDLISSQIPGHVAVWADGGGINVGMSGGMVNSITRRKLRLPAASQGAGLLYDNKYVALLAP